MSKELNKATEVLTLNSFEPYLPPFGYIDPSFPEDEMSRLKMQADKEFSPKTIATIYRNLLNNGYILPYSSEKPNIIVSYGSNIPTYERFLLDLDREKRYAPTHIISVDWHEFSPKVIESLTVGKTHQSRVNMSTSSEDTHQFIKANNKDFNLGINSTNLIWQYRSWLYYLLSGVQNEMTKIRNAKTVLNRHHQELTEKGTIVFDMAEYPPGHRNNFDMSTSTGELLTQYWEVLEMDDFYSNRVLGNGKERVLVLQKM